MALGFPVSLNVYSSKKSQQDFPLDNHPKFIPVEPSKTNRSPAMNTIHLDRGSGKREPLGFILFCFFP